MQRSPLKATGLWRVPAVLEMSLSKSYSPSLGVGQPVELVGGRPSSWWKSGLRPPEVHHHCESRSTERGGCRRPADAGGPRGSLWSPWWSDLSKSGHSWLVSNKGLITQNGVGWSQRQWVVEKMVSEVVAGEEVGVGDCLEAGRRGFPGWVLSKCWWSKRQTCLCLFLFNF